MSKHNSHFEQNSFRYSNLSPEQTLTTYLDSREEKDWAPSQIPVPFCFLVFFFQELKEAADLWCHVFKYK